jgi:hypothetical protein
VEEIQVFLADIHSYRIRLTALDVCESRFAASPSGH